MSNYRADGIDQRWGDTIAPPETFLSNKQAAEYLCVREKFLYTMRQRKDGPPYELRGRKVLYTLRGLKDWRKLQMREA